MITFEKFMLKVLLFSVILLSFISCTSHPTVTKLTSKSTQSLPVLTDEMNYSHLVWSGTAIVTVSSITSTINHHLHVYNLDSSSVEQKSIPTDLNCGISHIQMIERLPNQKIGIMVSCRNEELTTLEYRLLEWDGADNFIVLEVFDNASFLEDRNYFHPNAFTYSPDFNTLLMERNGDGINNGLVVLDTVTEDINEFLTRFARAGSPSWSNDGTLIAFAANGQSEHNPLNLANNIDAPWNIYTTNSQFNGVSLVLEGVKYVDYIKWIPDSSTEISFRGMIENQMGLWLYNVPNNKLTLIWEEKKHQQRIFYDWSPQSQAIVLLDCEKTNGRNQCTPKIITLE